MQKALFRLTLIGFMNSYYLYISNTEIMTMQLCLEVSYNACRGWEVKIYKFNNLHNIYTEQPDWKLQKTNVLDHCCSMLIFASIYSSKIFEIEMTFQEMTCIVYIGYKLIVDIGFIQLLSNPHSHPNTSRVNTI